MEANEIDEKTREITQAIMDIEEGEFKIKNWGILQPEKGKFLISLDMEGLSGKMYEVNADIYEVERK